MIYKFESQEERRNFGGSAFIEIAYCKKRNFISKLFNLTIKDFNNDSLYIHNSDITKFADLYSDIIGLGVYLNKEEGPFDPFGITYYSKEKIELIIKKLLKSKPVDYEILLNWLKECKNYEGFYILGI